jgi:hypothetical protein
MLKAKGIQTLSKTAIFTYNSKKNAPDLLMSQIEEK